MRGGNQGITLRSVLVDQLRSRRFEFKGKEYTLSTNAIEQIVRELTSPPMHEGLLAANKRVYEALTLGVTVTEFVEGKKTSVTVPIIDWDRPEANSFLVTEELEILSTDGTRTRRPDLACYVNGIPLAIIEAMRPDSGNPNKSMVDEGISQTIRNQKPHEIRHLFAYSQLLLSISHIDGRYGTTKTPRKFWSKWKEEEFSEAHFVEIKNRTLGAKPHRWSQERAPRHLQQ